MGHGQSAGGLRRCWLWLLCGCGSVGWREAQSGSSGMICVRCGCRWRWLCQSSNWTRQRSWLRTSQLHHDDGDAGWRLLHPIASEPTPKSFASIDQPRHCIRIQPDTTTTGRRIYPRMPSPLSAPVPFAPRHQWKQMKKTDQAKTQRASHPTKYRSKTKEKITITTT